MMWDKQKHTVAMKAMMNIWKGKFVKHPIVHPSPQERVLNCTNTYNTQTQGLCLVQKLVSTLLAQVTG